MADQKKSSTAAEKERPRSPTEAAVRSADQELSADSLRFMALHAIKKRCLQPDPLIRDVVDYLCIGVRQRAKEGFTTADITYYNVSRRIHTEVQKWAADAAVAYNWKIKVARIGEEDDPHSLTRIQVDWGPLGTVVQSLGGPECPPA